MEKSTVQVLAHLLRAVEDTTIVSQQWSNLLMCHNDFFVEEILIGFVNGTACVLARLSQYHTAAAVEQLRAIGIEVINP